MAAGDERVRKQVVLDWLNQMARDYPKMLPDAIVGCFQEEFDFWPDETNEDLSLAATNYMGAVRSSDPATSVAAAKAVYPRSGSLRHTVLMFIAHHGDHGATAHELEQATGIEYRSLTPRIGELKKAGFIRTNGETRVGGRGSYMDVNVLTDKGRRAVDHHDPTVLT